MNVAIFAAQVDDPTLQEVIAAVRSLGVEYSAYRVGRTWESLDGEELRVQLSDVTHIVTAVSSADLSSRWFSFLVGYGMGRECPVCLYTSLFDEALPSYLRACARVSSPSELLTYLDRERILFERSEAIDVARSRLLEWGMALSDEAFARAVSEGNDEAVQLFLRAGFSPDARDRNGVPVVSLAIRGRHSSIMKTLLERGADVNVASEDRGDTPLMEAAVRGEPEILDLLIESDADLNVVNKNRQTALMLAIGESYTHIARRLIEAGATDVGPDELGMTALKYAQLFHHDEIVALLQS